MKSFTYYLICFVNPVSRRPKETQIMFIDENDAKLFVYIQNKANPRYNFFYKAVTKNVYTSLSKYANDNSSQHSK